jgi:hypothetical protein
MAHAHPIKNRRCCNNSSIEGVAKQELHEVQEPINISPKQHRGTVGSAGSVSTLHDRDTVLVLMGRDAENPSKMLRSIPWRNYNSIAK